MSAPDAKRLKQLESENDRLKKLLAERDLEVEVLKRSPQKIVSAPRGAAHVHARRSA